ncbi:MAG TPA: WbqC family protein, partial [Puia sp.]|nr:WbqC family protein [Puia sp.]
MELIIESHYFSPLIFYKSSFAYTNIRFEQYESFQKMSFRNRCVIAGANGKIMLSIPLQHGREQKTLMKDVRISYAQRWQKDHWKTIQSCYNKSPWFEFYRDGLQELYGRHFNFLLDWNFVCLDWSLNQLSMPQNYLLTHEFIKKYDETVADWRNKILPRNYEDTEPLRYNQVFVERTG